MRRFIVFAAIAAVGVGLAAPAVANFVYPGRVIIGTGIYFGGGGIGIGGSTFNAAGEGDACVVASPIECECFPGMPLLEACQHTGVDISCLQPHTAYQNLHQTEPVLFVSGTGTLDGLICSGKSNETALVSLPLPKP